MQASNKRVLVELKEKNVSCIQIYDYSHTHSTYTLHVDAQVFFFVVQVHITHLYNEIQKRREKKSDMHPAKVLMMSRPLKNGCDVDVLCVVYNNRTRSTVHVYINIVLKKH